MNGVAKSESLIALTKKMLITLECGTQQKWPLMYAEMVVEMSCLDFLSYVFFFFFFLQKTLHAHVTVLFFEPVDKLVMASVLLYVKRCIIQP